LLQAQRAALIERKRRELNHLISAAVAHVAEATLLFDQQRLGAVVSFIEPRRTSGLLKFAIYVYEALSMTWLLVGLVLTTVLCFPKIPFLLHRRRIVLWLRYSRFSRHNVVKVTCHGNDIVFILAERAPEIERLPGRAIWCGKQGTVYVKSVQLNPNNVSEHLKESRYVGIELAMLPPSMVMIQGPRTPDEIPS
jgi:hypothetical protein